MKRINNEQRIALICACADVLHDLEMFVEVIRYLQQCTQAGRQDDDWLAAAEHAALACTDTTNEGYTYTVSVTRLMQAITRVTGSV